MAIDFFGDNTIRTDSYVEIAQTNALAKRGARGKILRTDGDGTVLVQFLTGTFNPVKSVEFGVSDATGDNQWWIVSSDLIKISYKTFKGGK